MCKSTPLTQRAMLRKIFEYQLSFGAFFLHLGASKSERDRQMTELEHCPEGSVGREVWLMLRRNGHELVEHYQNHDLKHVVLQYGQDPEEEMKMQAFMFGNAGFSLFMVTVFLMFVICTPGAWRHLPYHYRIGMNTLPIGHWTLKTHAHRNVQELRAELYLEQARQYAASQPKSYSSLIIEWFWLKWAILRLTP